MKKLIKFLGVLLAGVIIFSCVACNQPGKSAYEIAVENGFVGTEQEWLDSLKGKDGKSAYQIAIESGLFEGSQEDWIKSLNGEDGIDGANGLDGVNGTDGKDVFEVWYNAVKSEGYEGDYSDFLLEYIKGNILVTQEATVNYANNALLSSVRVYASSSKDGRQTYYTGGGTVIKDDKESGTAYIVTNFHVVYDPTTPNSLSENCYLMFYGMTFLRSGSDNPTQNELLEINAIKGTVIGGSFSNDIAVIKVENNDIYKDGPYRATKIGDSDKLIVGDNAIAIGNPLSEGLSITRGVISVDSQELVIEGADDYTPVELRVLRTDADVNRGNSGGGVFNSKGEFVGVVTAREFDMEIDGFGYAIPSNVAMGIANNIIQRYEDGVTVYEDEVAQNGFGFMKCTLGIEVYVASSVAVFDEIEGVVRIKERILVHAVFEGSAQAYIQPGDELVKASINGIERDVARLFTITDLLFNAKMGDVITIEVIRKINEIPTAVTLEIPLINSSYVL